MPDADKPSGTMRVIALDYGSAHTGVAVSDPTGTIVRPLDEIDNAASDDGIAAIAQLVATEGAELVVVGVPVSLSGELGDQARETLAFVARLADRLAVPVETWDERFTSKIARQRGADAAAGEHSIAASCMLDDFLASEKYRRLRQGWREAK